MLLSPLAESATFKKTFTAPSGFRYSQVEFIFETDSDALTDGVVIESELLSSSLIVDGEQAEFALTSEFEWNILDDTFAPISNWSFDFRYLSPGRRLHESLIFGSGLFFFDFGPSAVGSWGEVEVVDGSPQPADTPEPSLILGFITVGGLMLGGRKKEKA